MNNSLDLLRALNTGLRSIAAQALESTAKIITRTEDLTSGGNGSGWVLDSQHVVTNHHVVADAMSRVRLQFPNGFEVYGSVVGSDAQTDLAIIRSEDLEGRALEIRDEPVHPGELCLTVGAPLGYSDSVSLGIVSGLGRQIAMGDIKFEEVIQTDASINPGNSGGPLVDIEGQLIGVNFCKRTDSENIGFAIPVEIMRDVTSEILRTGEVRRGRLGIGISSQASDRGNCVVVTKTNVESPFETADELVSIDGTAIARRYDVLRILLQSSVIGSKVEVCVLRGGREITFDVAVEPEKPT